jgi:hypothetical protein
MYNIIVNWCAKNMFYEISEDGLLCEPPELFLLFVLSHGESGGKILTNHFKPKLTEQNKFVLTSGIA